MHIQRVQRPAMASVIMRSPVSVYCGLLAGDKSKVARAGAPDARSPGESGTGDYVSVQLWYTDVHRLYRGSGGGCTFLVLTCTDSVRVRRTYKLALTYISRNSTGNMTPCEIFNF